MPTYAQLCAALPAWGNVVGLVGTGLLAYGAVRAIPVATRLYRITLDIAALAAHQDSGADSPAAAEGTAAVGTTHPPTFSPALRAKLREQRRAYEQLLESWRQHLAGLRDRWTWRETAATLLGLVLTLASDALPLWAAWACPAAPSSAAAPPPALPTSAASQ